MSSQKSYKIQKGVPWQVLDGAVIVLAPKQRMAHELGETGSFVWLGITENKTVDEISQSLTEEFAVDFVTAQNDVLSFISVLEDKNLVEGA